VSENKETKRSVKQRMDWPERPVAEAVETLWRIVDSVHTSEITPDLMAQAAGLSPKGEHLRCLALALRSLGLVRASKAGLNVTRLGWELCEESPGSARYRRLLWEVIHTPPLYAILPNRFLRIVPSAERLMDYMIENHRLPYLQAEQAAVNYRDALIYAGLMSESGERLVPELRVLPRYLPTNTELDAVEPFGEHGEEPQPPEEYRVIPAMQATRISSGQIPTHSLDGAHADVHRITLELSDNRLATIELPSDVNSEEVARVIRLMRALVSK